MQELFSQLVTETRSAMRFRWYGMFVAWVASLAGWVLVAGLPDVYEGTARVYVETSSVLEPVLGNQIAVQNVEANLLYVREALTGRDLLETVIREVGLAEPAPARSPQDAHETLLEKLGAAIDIRTGEADSPNNVYTISYRHRERDKAVAVVATLLQSFVDDTLEANRTGSDTAERFLDERVAEYEARLQAAETALADFKKEHAARLPGAEGDYFARMQAERQALDAARSQLRVLQARHDQLLEQMDGETRVTPGLDANLDNLPPNSIDARIRDYQAALDEKLLDFTELHPDVIALREALDQLKARRAEQLAALGLEGTDAELAALGASPVYQALQIAVNETAVDMATLRADIEDRTGRVAELQSLINEVPEVEAQLARLNRDYDVIYEQYVELVRSRETQGLTRKATDLDQVDFRIINPPLASPDPVAPPRTALFTVVLLAALFAGGALCYVLSQLRPVFGSSTALRAVTGLPVLGVVTDGWVEQVKQARAKAARAFGSALVALIFIFAFVVVLGRLGAIPQF